MTRHAAGFIFGTPSHYYDHIASLCAFLDIPLIVTEVIVMEHLQEYYPTLVVLYFDYLSVAVETISRFDILLSCHPRPDLEKIFSFSEEMLKKRCTIFFIPHGNSDKGHKSQLIEGIRYEKLVGYYGKKMLDFFSEKGARNHLFGALHLGNFREKVYTRLKPHFQKLLEKSIPPKKAGKTIFFAPTWDDAEHSCSLFSIIDILIEKKPDNITLIVKPHPNTFLTDIAKIEQIQGKIDQHDNIFMVRDFPPIYTLLDRADIYLGDMSSIGYDFLTYNRPMFFLNPNRRDPKEDRGLQLAFCGEVLYRENYEAIYEIIQHDQIELKKRRHEMYHYTFGDSVAKEEMEKQLLTLSERFSALMDQAP